MNDATPAPENDARSSATLEPAQGAARIDRLIYFGLLLLPSLLMIVPLVRGAIPYFMDTMMYFYPLRVQAARVMAGGEWPLWNRGMMGGVPLFENPQAALGYPLHWPSLIWPNGFWFTFPMTLQLGAYGALTAWALRRMGVGRWHAAWAGAMALAGGYGWSRLQSGNYMNVLPWLPLWLGAAHAFAETRRVRWLAAGAAAVGMMLLAGAHQLAAYALAAFGLYALVQIALTHGARRAWLGYAAGSVALGLMLGAPGWLPQIGFIRETTRAEGVQAERVIGGALHDPMAYFDALQGSPALIKLLPGEPWADAEGCATVGMMVLALALLTPPRGELRRAWIGCWVGIGASVLLAAGPVVAWLLPLVPATGMFHDPRRWLGVTQWLLLLAAGVNLPALTGAFAPQDGRVKMGEPRVRWWLKLDVWRMIGVCVLVVGLIGLVALDGSTSGAARVQLIVGLLAVMALMLPRGGFLRGWGRGLERAALSVGLALLAHATWVSVEVATIPARALTQPEPAPLLARAGLKPGERFFSLDYERAVSYGYRGPDALAWMRPNLGMLFGYEDLGGYEPAQSARFRRFMDEIHAVEPWRRIAPNHFGVVQNAAARTAFDEGNVRWALLPRWGEPQFFLPLAKGIWHAHRAATLGEGSELRVLVLAEDGAASVPLGLAERDAAGLRHHEPGAAAAPTTADDWGTSGTSTDASPVMLNPDLRISRTALDNVSGSGEGEWRLSVPRGGRLIDAFAWDAQRSALWEPVARREDGLEVLARYRGVPARYAWRDEAGREIEVEVISETIGANWVRVEYATGVGVEGPVEMTQHDAWWPGWSAQVDGEASDMRGLGLWRVMDVPAGRHVVEFRYRAPRVRDAAGISGFGMMMLALIGLRAKRIRSKPIVYAA